MTRWDRLARSLPTLAWSSTMRNCPFHALCAMIVALSLARPAAAGRCAGPSSVTPVKGAPGTFRIVTRHGASFAYSPPPPREGVNATYLIYAEDHFWQSKP
ncbi:MAG: hypothetical protein HYR73_09430, partial [Candidatus Eisenbacteria bacterium]|nr:hypothetical protein [Candidatus Eisenbacteria bacterium]